MSQLDQSRLSLCDRTKFSITAGRKLLAEEKPSSDWEDKACPQESTQSQREANASRNRSRPPREVREALGSNRTL